MSVSRERPDTSPIPGTPAAGTEAPASVYNGDEGGVSRRTLLKGAVAGGAISALGGLSTAAPALAAPAPLTQPLRGGKLREYWIQVDAFYHNMVPTGLDGMMGTRYTPGQTSFWALGYRAYTPGWRRPLPGSDEIGANTGIPGPILRGAVGDTIRVHFRNNDTHYKFPHSMHPHGVLYTPPNDGAWTYAFGDKPGTAVQVGESYTYEWQVVATSVGTWPYHDHSIPHSLKSSDDQGMPVMELNAELGMFGILALTDQKTPRVDRELCLFFHDIYADDIPGLNQDFDCFNGYAFLGNTPEFHVKVGERVRWRVAALGKEFHVFHLHGHRWAFNGRNDDALVFGPSTTLTFEYVEDNPGTWLYHCHVTDHMAGGMMGLYIAHP